MAGWSENAKVILSARYLMENETPDEMLVRVAKCVSQAEDEKVRKSWENKFLSIMDSLEFLPNSPCLINAGRKLGQLSACFVLPIEDQIEAIFEAVKQSAIIHKSGGGTGFNFSKLRPTNSVVASTRGVASGPVSFMKVFNTTTEVIKQGGVRRGANIGILNVSHPDIIEFVECKNGDDFQNFNTSVAMYDNFFDCVNADRTWYLHFRKMNHSKIRAKDLFDKICYNAWNSGEPGILFLSTINQSNPIPWMGRLEAVNPCGENPLFPWESCNLGSIDISKFEDLNKLKEVVKIAVRFLDDVIDVNKFPTVKIERKTKLTRKIGLGIMGWADFLAKKGIQYDSEEALELADFVMKMINEVAYSESKKIGREKGFCFPSLKRRNTTLLTIAPTGTLSILADCSNGIEPYFAQNYTKNVLNGTKLEFGTLDSKAKTALEILPESHVKMQAAFQDHVDNAISKTVNLPESATVEDVKGIILLAHSLGVKGVTVYRQGSREEAPLEELSECEKDRCLI